ncbi:hypothetical protein AX14_006718 [Amanita brunnescens Koide BX004]|nr:hypothetical protein AX14_006718 [Amanita brunnescens Koide BX004]
MPFFSNSKDFQISGGEMNDVAGDLTKNTTSNNTTNNDSENVTIGSNISKDNTTTQKVKIGELDYFLGANFG